MDHYFLMFKFCSYFIVFFLPVTLGGESDKNNFIVHRSAKHLSVKDLGFLTNIDFPLQASVRTVSRWTLSCLFDHQF